MRGEGAFGKLHRGTWESRRGGGDAANLCRESITGKGLRWQSERPIVARRRGNARGAKGPCLGHVESEERRAAWTAVPLGRVMPSLLYWKDSTIPSQL